MSFLNTFLSNIRFCYHFLNDTESNRIARLKKEEYLKTPKRYDIINYLLQFTSCEYYLEIGVRNPDHNFNKIKCRHKLSVDPGLEFKANPVKYQLTSDVFFHKFFHNELDVSSDIKFDIIFIDGLHQSYQLERDILNTLSCISDVGFIVLHDCNPISEYHTRENFNDKLSPARDNWNGTSWKAFYKFRHRSDIYSACIDTDWGVGILSKNSFFNKLNNLKEMENPFYEFSVLENNRSSHLNLISFNQLIS
ncbi:MAG: class I SAM-dependent methyltransferase [Bacteroidota bacterium]